jgi:hypothetical protein
MRKSILLLLSLAVAIALLGTSSAALAEGDTIHVYKSPTCGCCAKWIDHLEKNGFEVSTSNVPDVAPIKRANGVPAKLASCHTAVVGGYVIEGHVPAADITRLLAERPKIAGLAVPGMPTGSPGMEGPNPERYEVIAFDSSAETSTFATHGP